MNKIAHEDVSKLSFLERYFTGSDFLIATWMFLLCGLPLFGYTGYILADDSGSLFGWELLVGSVGYVAILSVWVIASMPENLVANDGRGSSHFFDYVFQPYCFPLFCCYGVCCRCCCNSTDLAFWKVHLGTDMLAGGWLFFLMAALLMPYAIYYAIVSPHLSLSHPSMLLYPSHLRCHLSLVPPNFLDSRSPAHATRCVVSSTLARLIPGSPWAPPWASSGGRASWSTHRTPRMWAAPGPGTPSHVTRPPSLPCLETERTRVPVLMMSSLSSWGRTVGRLASTGGAGQTGFAGCCFAVCLLFA